MSNSAPIDITNSQPVATDAKVFALLQLQRIGYKVGQIKISDFMRRDEDDEIAHKVKQDRGLQDWLDSLRFSDFSDKVSAFIGEQTKVVDKTIDEINETINQLKAMDGDDGDAEPAITALRAAKTNLKKQKADLSDSSRRLNKARNIGDIESIATNTESTASNVSRIQNNAQNIQSDVDVLLNIYDIPRTNSGGSRARTGSSSGSLSSHHNSQNNGTAQNASDPEDKRVIKIGLRLLSQEDDDVKVTTGLKALISRFTRPEVKSALAELKSNDESSKFDRVSANMDRINSSPASKPAPSA